MKRRDVLEATFRQHECGDFRWLDPRRIVVAEWVRMKCRFGCPRYGKSRVCPPNVPSVAECQRFFDEYEEAVLFHFTRTVERPEDRHSWTRSINGRLLKLERAVFLERHEKALVLFTGPCNLCDDCTGDPAECTIPQSARPAPEGLAVDVFSTARNCGYQIRVLTDYSQQMDRFGMLLVQ
ncbi:MAG: DUF2284 domain-containing protein [Phycisphaerales bacterium]|nr:MAG: DUF2284 domain-containing protein [Phycisphaerales bacterium]